MTQSERICDQLFKKGKWTRANCSLCRKIYKDKCSILAEINRINDKQLNKEKERGIK